MRNKSKGRALFIFAMLLINGLNSIPGANAFQTPDLNEVSIHGEMNSNWQEIVGTGSLMTSGTYEYFEKPALDTGTFYHDLTNVEISNVQLPTFTETLTQTENLKRGVNAFLGSDYSFTLSETVPGYTTDGGFDTTIEINVDYVSTDNHVIETFNDDFMSSSWELYDVETMNIDWESYIDQDAGIFSHYPTINYGNDEYGRVADKMVDGQRIHEHFLLGKQIPYLYESIYSPSILTVYAHYPFSSSSYVGVISCDYFNENSVTWNNQPTMHDTVNDNFWINYVSVQDTWIENNIPLSKASEGYKIHAHSNEFRVWLRSSESPNKPIITHFLNKLYQDTAAGYAYMQTAHSETLNMRSNVYASDIAVTAGDHVKVDCQTLSSEQLMMNLWNDGVIVKSIEVIGNGNTDHSRHVIDVMIDEHVEFDQISFNGIFDNTEYFKAWSVKVEESQGKNFFSNCYIDNFHYEVLNVQYTESFELFLDEGSTDSRNPTGNYAFFFDSTFFTNRNPIDDVSIPSQTLDIRLTLMMNRDVDITVNVGFSSNNWIVPSFVDLRINDVAVSDTGMNEGFLSLMNYPEELVVTANQDCYFKVSMTTMFSFEIILEVLSRTYLRKAFTLRTDHDVELSSIDFDNDLEIKKMYLNNIDHGAVDPLDFFPLKEFPQLNTFSLEIILLDDMYLPLNQYMEGEMFDFYHQEFDQETDEMAHSYSLEVQDITIDGNLEMKNTIPTEHVINDWNEWSMDYDPLHSAPSIMNGKIRNELTAPFIYSANLEDFYYYHPHVLTDGDLSEVDGDTVDISNPTHNYQSEEFLYYFFRMDLDALDLSISNGYYLDYHVDRTSFTGVNGYYGGLGYWDSGSIFRLIVNFSSNTDQIISGTYHFNDPSMEFEPGMLKIQFSSFGVFTSDPEDIHVDQMRLRGHGDTVATIQTTLDFPLFLENHAPSLQNLFRITAMIDVANLIIIDPDADLPSTVTIASINGGDLITQEIMFELNPVVDPIPSLTIELSNMEVELHINYKVEFLCLNKVHEYPGTYTFEDGIVPVRWQVDSGSLDDVQVISEHQGHSNVLEVDSVEISDRFDVNQEQGILEAWILSPSMDNFIGLLGFLSDTPSPDGSSLAMGFVNGHFACTDSTGLVHLPISYDANRWYHVKIDFNTDLGVYHAWINDVPVNQGDSFTITNADGSFLSKAVIASSSSFHVDGIGYSWDPEYTIGDNNISVSEREIHHYFTINPCITQENHDFNSLQMYLSFDVSFSPTMIFEHPYHFPDFARDLFSCRISIMTEGSTETWYRGFDHEYKGTILLDITEMLQDRNKEKMVDMNIEFYIIGVDTSIVIDDLKLTSKMIPLQLTETPRTTVNGVKFSEEMLATRNYDHWFFETKMNASDVSLFNQEPSEIIEDLTKEGKRYFFDAKCSENGVLTATIEYNPKWFVLYEVLEHNGTHTKIKVDYKADFPIMNVDLILDFGNEHVVNDEWTLNASQNLMTHELTIPGIFFTREMQTLYIEGYSAMPHAVISSHESDQCWNHITTTTEIDYKGFIRYPKYTHAFLLNKEADWNAYNIHYGTETYSSETISDTSLKVSGEGFDPSIEDSYLHFRTLPFKEVDFVFENNIITITIRTNIDVQNCYFMYAFDPIGVHTLSVIESNISITELTDSGDFSGYLYFACTEIKEGLTIIKIAVNFATPLEMIVQAAIIFVITGVFIGVYYYVKNNERKLQEIKGLVDDKVISKLKREKDNKGLNNVQIDTKNDKIIINFKNK